MMRMELYGEWVVCILPMPYHFQLVIHFMYYRAEVMYVTLLDHDTPYGWMQGLPQMTFHPSLLLNLDVVLDGIIKSSFLSTLAKCTWPQEIYCSPNQVQTARH